MIKLLIFTISIFLLSNNNTFAECDLVHNNLEKENVDNAIQVLKNTKNIIKYCPICPADKNLIQKIAIKETFPYDSEKYGWALKINKKDIDLYSIYLPTEKSGIYRNLAYVLGCTRGLDDVYIREYLDENDPYGFERIEKLNNELYDCKNDKCVNEVYHKIMGNYWSIFRDSKNRLNLYRMGYDNYSKKDVADILFYLAYEYGYRDQKFEAERNKTRLEDLRNRVSQDVLDCFNEKHPEMKLSNTLNNLTDDDIMLIHRENYKDRIKNTPIIQISDKCKSKEVRNLEKWW